MSTKNLKTGKKAKAKTKIVTGILSGGLLGEELKAETVRIHGYRAGTKNIPALFWSVTSLSNGQKVTVVNKENGNE